ncbi:MAG: SurA N-terminal domain-containing protein [Turneriella sp.]|nr:SurA N-terminal domain-containing protein [Turneriella sp.]
MAETAPSLREKIVRVGTWIFLSFIFLIIVLSFGMPDFIGTSARVDQYNAARIGNEYLTRAEVADYQKQLEERMAQNLGKLDAQNRKLFEDLAKSRALEEAIERKIFTQLLSRAGFTPTSSSEPKILANFYKKQFAEFIVDGKLDTKRLNEYLSARRMSLEQVARGFLRDYGPAKAYAMLENTNYASDFAVLDEARFATTLLSYRIVAIDSSAKDKILRNRFNPTEKEIQEKFQAEFLSKDPKAVLDVAKRESIRATLFNEKRAVLEKEWFNSLSQARDMVQVANTTTSKFIALDNVTLPDYLVSKKGKDVQVGLMPLAQSDFFLRQRLVAPLGKVLGPVEAGGYTYFFAITNRSTSPLPTAEDYRKADFDPNKAFAGKKLPQEAEKEKLAQNLGKNTQNQLLTAALEIYRNSVRIERYKRE